MWENLFHPQTLFSKATVPEILLSWPKNVEIAMLKFQLYSFLEVIVLKGNSQWNFKVNRRSTQSGSA